MTTNLSFSSKPTFPVYVVNGTVIETKEEGNIEGHITVNLRAQVIHIQ